MPRLTLDITDEGHELLNRLAAQYGTTKAELLRRAISLIEAAAEARKVGHGLAVVNKAGRMVNRIIGL